MTLARILFPALLLVSGMAHGDYRFESNAIIQPTAPWSANDRVIGTIEVDAPLSPWTTGVDLRTRITALNFHDGVSTYSLADTEICDFEVTVDANGAIMDWRIDLYQGPRSMPGAVRHRVTIEPDWVFVFVYETNEGSCEQPPPWDALQITNGSTAVGDNGSPAPAAVYRYASAPFVSAEDPFQVGDSFVATIQFAGPIPPSRTDFELAPFAEAVAVEPVINPYVQDVSVCSLRVDTDASGRIVEWQGVISEQVPRPVISPPPGFSSVRGWGLGSTGDDARAGFFSVCEDAPLALAAGGGTWRGGAVVPVPALSAWALAVLVVGLMTVLVIVRGGFGPRRPNRGRSS